MQIISTLGLRRGGQRERHQERTLQAAPEAGYATAQPCHSKALSNRHTLLRLGLQTLDA
jgi:hypothetical protein